VIKMTTVRTKVGPRQENDRDNTRRNIAVFDPHYLSRPPTGARGPGSGSGELGGDVAVTLGQFGRTSAMRTPGLPLSSSSSVSRLPERRPRALHPRRGRREDARMVTWSRPSEPSRISRPDNHGSYPQA